MKKTIYTLLIAVATISGFSSCGPKCKTCQAEVFGVKGPEQELCGEQLKAAEASGTYKCK